MGALSFKQGLRAGPPRHSWARKRLTCSEAVLQAGRGCAELPQRLRKARPVLSCPPGSADAGATPFHCLWPCPLLSVSGLRVLICEMVTDR